MKTALKTLINYQDYIKIRLKHLIPMECLKGLINKIKVIKRMAFDTVVSIISKLEF